MTPTQLQFLTHLAYLYLEYRQARKADTLLQALIGLSPEDHGLRLPAAYAAMLCGDHQRAFDLVQHYLRDEPADPPSGYLLKAKALWGLGRHQEAQTAIQVWQKG